MNADVGGTGRGNLGWRTGDRAAGENQILGWWEKQSCSVLQEPAWYCPILIDAIPSSMLSPHHPRNCSMNFIRRAFSTKMLAKMSHNWLRTMMLITNPLTTIGPCMARERFCAMQSPFQIRICSIHDEHGYCEVACHKCQSCMSHNFSAPLKCDQRARRDVTSN